MTQLIDTHCHLTHGRLRNQLDAVLDRAAEANVMKLICATGCLGDSRQAAALAKRYPQVHALAGVHPHDATDAPDDYLTELESLLGKEKNVAIGEIGLDYHYNFSPPETQRRVFAEQLELAKKLNKRIVIHTREAFEDTLAILRESQVGGEHLLFHSCTAPPADVRRALDLGAMISFSGIVTFDKATDVQAAARIVPDERLLIETDAPFLTPEPVRKMKTNEPANVVYVARFLASLYRKPLDHVIRTTTANAIRWFRLED